MRTKTLFISDIHLRGLNDAREKDFIDFMHQQSPLLQRLVIVGDLFDFWVGYNHVIYYPYWPILQILMELQKAGVEIHYIEGNHDFHLGSFFKDMLKCHIYPHEAHLNFEGKKMALYHGDTANPKEWGHRLMRAFFRSRFTRWALSWVHPDWVWKLGHKASSLSHRFHPKAESQAQQVKVLYRQFAETKLIETQSDVVIVGHSHYPEEVFFQQGTYYNLGDWVTHFSYLELENKKFRLIKNDF